MTQFRSLHTAARLLVGTLCLALGALPSLAVDAPAGPVVLDAARYALIGVTVVDGTGGDVRHEQTVLIEHGRIAALGDADAQTLDEEVLRIRLHGRTVIPGLVGMHNHSHMPGRTFMPATLTRLSLASGVTTLRTVGAAEAEREIALAAAIESGEVIGPRIIPSAPYVSGPGGNPPMDKPATPEAARAFVRRWADKGAKWIKLYRHVQPQIAEAIIDEAHRLGLKVAGHLCSLSFAEAAELGIDSIEHGLISATDFVEDRAPGACVSPASSIDRLDIDSPAVAVLIEQLVKHQVAVVATPAIIESHFPHRPQADARALAAFSPAWRQAYAARQTQLAASAASSRYRPALLAKLRSFERRFVAAGGLLAAGPDPGRHVLSGHGDQRNFELLVESGFSVPQAVRILTANGAQILGEGGRFGRVAAGLLADLVVLEGDLMQDPTAIRRPRMVIKDGIGYDPAALIRGWEARAGLEEDETDLLRRPVGTRQTAETANPPAADVPL